MFVNRRDVQIQWGDCDPANIVYYPRYFAMFDDSTSVLFEKAARDAGQLMGRTPYLQPVHVTADATLIGTVADVKIERRTANSLHGVLV